MLKYVLPESDDRHDVLIVGAGAVGLALAVTLTRRGKKVLVVECGSEQIAPDFARLNTGLQSGQKHLLGLQAGRYKGLGGTTRLWGGQLMPFSASDFLPDALNNKPGWLFGKADLEPYYDAALALLGIDGGLSGMVRQWCEKTQRPLALGPALELTPSIWMKQPDLTIHFRQSIQSAAGPTILLRHEAIGIVVDRVGGRVDGIILRGPSGDERGVRADAIVLACGTLEISRLLLRIQANELNTPLASNPNVGKWYVDHLHGIAGAIHPSNRAEFGALFDTFYAHGHKITPKVRLNDDHMAACGLSNCAGTVNSPFGPGEAVRELRSLGKRVIGRGSGVEGLSRAAALRSAVSTMRIMGPLAWRYFKSRRSSKFAFGDVTLGLELEQIPTEKSFIYLEPGVPAKVAKVGVNWSLDGRELNTVTHFTAAMQKICRDKGLGELEIDPRIVAGDPGFFGDCYDASHQTGGARMASNAKAGVVDAGNAVHGMPGLYVVGAATFPSASFANPTLTAIATAIRLADGLTRNGTRT